MKNMGGDNTSVFSNDKKSFISEGTSPCRRQSRFNATSSGKNNAYKIATN